MEKRNKRGITLTSIVVYVILFFLFTTITTIISSRINNNLFDDRGTAINITAINKLEYNLLKSADDSYSVEGKISGNKTIISFSNSDEYVFDLDKKIIYKNGGELVKFVKDCNVKLLDDLIVINISLNKYTNEVNRNIKVSIPTKEYIQNGLISHFDSINNTGKKFQDKTSTVWKDLKNLNKTINANNIEWTDNGIIAKAASTGVLGHGSFPAVTYQIRFITPTEMNDYGVLINQNGANFLYTRKDVKLMYGFGHNTAFYGGTNIPTNKSVTLTFVQVDNKTRRCYVDNSYVTATMNDDVTLTWVSINSITILESSRIVQSVRIYNRALTSEEIAKNNMIDRLRFGK